MLFVTGTGPMPAHSALHVLTHSLTHLSSLNANAPQRLQKGFAAPHVLGRCKRGTRDQRVCVDCSTLLAAGSGIMEALVQQVNRNQ